MLQTLKKYPICVSLSKGLDAVSIVQPLINTKSGFNIMEIWRTIEDYPDYMVSNKGRIKSMRRTIHRSDGRSKRLKTKVLKPWYGSDNHLYINLSKNKKKVHNKVSRLVGKAFIPNPENKPEINHKDGVKNNNKVENLEWNTSSENIIHAYDTGLLKRGEDFYNSKFKNKQILEIRTILKKGSLSQKRISEIFGVCQATIHNIKIGKSYKSVK